MSEVLRGIADVYDWPDPMASTEQEMTAMTPEIVARYQGAYRFPAIPDAPFDILADGRGGLVFDRRDGHTSRCSPLRRVFMRPTAAF